ncbi:MAG TPA: trypsin-like peptidase domain-containing protein [Chroococcales cyanobacterium]
MKTVARWFLQIRKARLLTAGLLIAAQLLLTTANRLASAQSGGVAGGATTTTTTAATKVRSHGSSRSGSHSTRAFTESSSASDPLTPDEIVNIRVYKQCNPAVVNITSLTASEDIFYNIVPQEGCGSGTIVSPEGYILTNDHVIDRAQVVRVTLYDGTSYQAKLIGADPDNDLAVIKIDVPKDKQLHTITFGDSSKLEVGRRVLAIGNPFGFERTMSAGIISSLGRTLKTERRLIKGVIQTDASINPGNSGGPLLDSSGRMIAITTAIFSQTHQSAGIGLGIPINIAKRIIPELIAYHKVRRPELGIDLVQATDLGLRVIKIDPRGAAAQAGVEGPKLVTYNVENFSFRRIEPALADVITGVDSMPVRSMDDLLSYVEQKKPGQVVTLTILRGGKLLKIPVKLTLGSSA